MTVDINGKTPSYPGEGVIQFYSTKGEYGFLSNFFRSPFTLDGKLWLHVEGYFQSQKYAGMPREEEIRLATSPMVAARLGRSRRHAIRPDWDQIKLDVMRKAVKAKFDQNPDLRKRLLSTERRPLIEHTRRDRFYGDGGDGSGANWLGVILAEVREALRSQNRIDQADKMTAAIS